MGYEEMIEKVQDLYLDGQKNEAAAAIPRELIERLSLIGPPDKIATTSSPGGWSSPRCSSPGTRT